MTVFEKIKTLLEKSRVDYEILEHSPVYTSEEAAKIRDLNPHMGAKALVCLADKKPVLLVLPGDKKVDFKKFKKSFGIRDLRMATPEMVKDLTTLEVGSIPPVGKAMGIPSYYDEGLKDNEKVAFNAGLHTISVIMNTLDLIKVEDPVIASFT